MPGLLMALLLWPAIATGSSLLDAHWAPLEFFSFSSGSTVSVEVAFMSPCAL